MILLFTMCKFSRMQNIKICNRLISFCYYDVDVTEHKIYIGGSQSTVTGPSVILQINKTRISSCLTVKGKQAIHKAE